MTARYHYDGILSDQVASWVQQMIQNYPFPVEVADMPPVDEFDALFTDRSWVATGEDCMGQPTTSHRAGVPYGYVRKTIHNDDRGGFLFLQDSESYTRFIEGFPNLVVNPKPFRTEFT